MAFMSESDLPPPINYDDRVYRRDESPESIDDNFDFDANVNENHFSIPTNIPTVQVVKFHNFVTNCTVLC